jgi:Leucine-rich repeat (LRR) protein
MKTIILTLLLVFVTTFNGYTQCPTQTGLYLESQADVDNFSTNYPGCIFLPNTLIIEDDNDTPITNLNGLSQLEGIGGNLTFNLNPDLISLSGLNNLASIGGNFTIINFHQFNDLSGLESLQSIGGDLKISNNGGPTSLNGLNNLNSIGGDLGINGNDNLQSLNGLENLQGSLVNLSISGNNISQITSLDGISNILENIEISNCNALINTQGLHNIVTISNDLNVNNNSSMQTLNFDNLTSIGNDFEIGQMASLEDFGNMQNMTSVGRDFHIISCAISSLQGLNNLTTIGRRLEIKSNFNLFTTSGLDNIEYIGENLLLTSNDNLQNVNGFNSLEIIEGQVDIYNNDDLTSLEGFSSLTAINGNSASNDGIQIYGNDALIDLEGFNALIYIGGILDIQNNQNLQNLSGLNSLQQVAGDLELNGDALTDFSALLNLTGIEGDLEVIGCDAIGSLEGLNNIDHTTITDINIYSNNNLSYCGVQSICNWIDANPGQANINNNITGCDTEAEVQTSCDNGPPPCDHPDYEALIDLYNSTNGDYWINNNGWQDGSNGDNCAPCTWFGIICNSDDRVTEIVLEENSLSGSIPNNIGDFPFLRVLNLRSNNIFGSIPNSIGNLDLLEVLYLYLNSLTGIIPNNIGDLSNLTNMSLRDNLLTGNIPSDLGDMTSLQDLRLQKNNLYGEIPTSIGSLQSLTFLSLRSNNLTGPIPTSLGNLNQLQELWLHSNNLSGNLSTFLGDLSLNKLRLENNNFSGCYPTSFLNLCNIQDINTSNNPQLPWEGDINQFCMSSGTISAQLNAPCNDGISNNGDDVITENCECGQVETSSCPTEYVIEYPESVCETELFDFEITFDSNESIDIEIKGTGNQVVASAQGVTSPLIISIDEPQSQGNYQYTVTFYENGQKCLNVDRLSQSTSWQTVKYISLYLTANNTICEEEGFEVNAVISDPWWEPPFEITLTESPTNNTYTKIHTTNSVFATFNLSGRPSGTYSYQATMVNDIGCVAESEIKTIEIYKKAEFNIENTIIEVCQNSNEDVSIDLLTYESGLSLDDILWYSDVSGNQPIDAELPFVIYQNSIIYFQVNTSEGCFSEIHPFVILLSGSPTPLIFALGSPNNIVCTDEEIEVEVIGDYSAIQWDHGPTSQLISVSAGTYTVTVTNDQCEGIGSITITEGGAQELICSIDGTNVTLSAEGAILPIDIYYESENGNEEILGVNSVNFTLDDFESGNYLFTVIDALGCSVTCESVILSNSEIETDIKVYPNPTHDFIYISSNIKYDMRLISITGERVIQMYHTSSIDLSDVITGVYILEITDKNRAVVNRQKVMKY